LPNQTDRVRMGNKETAMRNNRARLITGGPEEMAKYLMERPDWMPEGVWRWLPPLPFEYPSWGAILPLPRFMLDKLFPPAAPLPPVTYACPYCGAVFSTIAELLAHIASEHPAEPPQIIYVCPICGAQFYSLEALNEHIATAHPEIPPAPPEVFTCPICGATFATQAELDYHMATVHPEVPPPPEEADIRISSLTISPTEVSIGEKVSITVVATNYGGARGTQKIVCKVNSKVSEQSVSLDANKTTTVPFEATPHEARNYYVSVNGLTGSFTAVEAPAAKFAYVSTIRSWDAGGNTYLEVDIQNIGSIPGECTVTFGRRVFVTVVSPSRWSGWTEPHQYTLRAATLQPGEVVTFSAYYHDTSWQRQYKCESNAGIILEPPEPKLYICRYCMLAGLGTVSFDTKAELDAHIASAHPEYLPMPLLTHFTLRGISWPDDFIMDGQHMGRIVRWDAEICLSDEEGCPGDSGWSGALKGGPVDVSQPLDFTMPPGWLSAYPDIANSLKIRIGGTTDLGWGTWICDSPRLERVPDGSTITFEVTSRGCTNWKVTGGG